MFIHQTVRRNRSEFKIEIKLEFKISQSNFSFRQPIQKLSLCYKKNAIYVKHTIIHTTFTDRYSYIIKNTFHRKLAYMYKNNKSIINMISPTDFTIVEKFKFHFDKK